MARSHPGTSSSSPLANWVETRDLTNSSKQNFHALVDLEPCSTLELLLNFSEFEP